MGNRILVIDDDALVREAFRYALVDAGHAVRFAADGEQGVALAREWRPDVVFLDLRMPGIDGVETLRRLRAQYADIAVWVVTAHTGRYQQTLDTERARGARFEVVAKPLDAAQIRRIAASGPPDNGQAGGTHG